MKEIEGVRDKWVEYLHICSYECMKIQMGSLIDQIRSKTGKDPYFPNDEVSKGEAVTGVFLDLGISCSKLPLNSFKHQPNTFCSLHMCKQTAGKVTWQLLGRTEIVEGTSSPRYYKLISLDRCHTADLREKLKLNVHAIMEKMTTTSVLIGSLEFTLMEILCTPNLSSQYPIASLKYEQAGFVHIDIHTSQHQLTLNKDSGVVEFNRLLSQRSISSGDLESLVSANSLKRSFKLPIRHLDPLSQTNNPNLINTTHTNNDNGNNDDGNNKSNKSLAELGDDEEENYVLLREVMSEFKHCFSLPAQILRFFIEDEQRQIIAYRALGTLHPSFEQRRRRIIEFHISTIANYQQQHHYLSNCKDTSFKASMRKDHKEVEFIPTNLHTQTVTLQHTHHHHHHHHHHHPPHPPLLHPLHPPLQPRQHDDNDTLNNNVGDEGGGKDRRICHHFDDRFDVVTVGAFTAYSQKYKSGGLKRMKLQLDAMLKKAKNGDVLMKKSKHSSRYLEDLQGRILHSCDVFCSMCVSGDTASIVAAFEALDSLVKRLMSKCKDPLIADSLQEYSLNNTSIPPSPITHSQGLLLPEASSEYFDVCSGVCSVDGSPLDTEEAVQKLQMPSLAELKVVNSDVGAEEPWEMQLLNTEATLVCLRGQLMGIQVDEERLKTKWLETLSPLIIKMRSHTRNLIDKCLQALFFNNLQDISDNLPLYHTLKYRRDIVFCQALTSLVAGVLLKLSSLLSPTSQPSSPSSSFSKVFGTASSSFDLLDKQFKISDTKTFHSVNTNNIYNNNNNGDDDDDGGGGDDDDDDDGGDDGGNDNNSGYVNDGDDDDDDVNNSNSKYMGRKGLQQHREYAADARAHEAMARVVKVGMLVQFESLLSCYGDEMYMLEDQWSGMDELSRVKFRLVCKKKSLPFVKRPPTSISGSRRLDDQAALSSHIMRKIVVLETGKDVSSSSSSTPSIIEEPNDALKGYLKRTDEAEKCLGFYDIRNLPESTYPDLYAAQLEQDKGHPLLDDFSESSKSTEPFSIQDDKSSMLFSASKGLFNKPSPSEKHPFACNATSCQTPTPFTKEEWKLPTTHLTTKATTTNNHLTTPSTTVPAGADDVTYDIIGDRHNCTVVLHLPEHIYRRLHFNNNNNHNNNNHNHNNYNNDNDENNVTNNEDNINANNNNNNSNNSNNNNDESNSNNNNIENSSIEFGVVPVLFSMGINEQATLAEKVFNTDLQDAINRDNFYKLNNYCKDYNSLPGGLRSADEAVLTSLMDVLRVNILEVKKSKNVHILHLAAKATRLLDGVRFTSCKSAKDRTAMSVTLEEASFVEQNHPVKYLSFQKVLDSLRSEGVRRENSLKNSGVRKYAFNSIQLVSIPKLYRPPKGTYGNLET